MTRRGIIIAGFVALAFAIAEIAVFPWTLSKATASTDLSLVAAVLGLLTAGIAGRMILGTAPVHRYFSLGVPVLAAISGLVLESSVTNWIITVHVNTGTPPAVILSFVIGGVVYLITATIYGFAGTRQGVPVRRRTGLLMLLLLAVLPGANILGIASLLFVTFLLGRAGFAVQPSATPAPPATSA